MKKNYSNFVHSVCPFVAFHFAGRQIWIVILIASMCVSTISFGQEYLWHKQILGNGVNNSTGNDVVVDATGNTYVVGRFGGTVNFGGISLTSFSPSGDIFIAKYINTGALSWVNKIGAANGNCNATGAALYKDGSNNLFLYVSGYFTSNNGSIIAVDFNPATGIDNYLTMNDASGDAFVAKYNVTGSNSDYLWATRVANSRADVASGGKVAVDGSGNVYMASTDSFSGGTLKKFNISNGTEAWSVNVGSGANDVAVRTNTIYVAGYNLAGSSRPLAWYNSSGSLVGSTGATDRSFSRLTLDTSTGIYAVGGIVNTSQDDVVIERYSTTTSSTPVWNKLFYSGINGFSADIAVGGSTGEIMVTGWFKGTVNFNSPGSYATTLTSSGTGTHDNVFVARYYASGGNLEWVKNNTSNTSTGQSDPLAIACTNNLVHVLGFVMNRSINAAFCGPAQSIDAPSASNAYLATYTQRLFAPIVSGPLSTLPGETEDYSVNTLAGAKAHDWFVPPGWTINYYGNPPGYNPPLKTYMFVSVGNNSGNVSARAVYDCGNSSLTNLYVTVGGGGHFAAFYPNPANETLQIEMESFEEPASAILIDYSGNKVKEAFYDPANDKTGSKLSFDVSALPNGLYFLHLNTSDKSFKEHISIKH